MPRDTIIGRDVLLYFLVNGIYQQAACATECSFNVHTDTVEVTTKTHNQGQGSWRKLKPVFNSWSASVSGIQLLDTPLKFSDIRKMQTDLQTIYIQVAKVSKSGTRYENWFGAGVITDTNETAGTDDFAQFDIQIEGYGALTADFDPTNLNQPLEMWYYYEATGNEGRSWVIRDLQGYLVSGRIYREGMEISPSGIQTTNRPATDLPIANKFKWDTLEGRITLSDSDPVLSTGERIDIPYTISYSGCSLAINNYKVALDSNGKFVETWQGTGIPKSQLLFQYSTDFGTNFNTLDVDLDPVNLDNATAIPALDTSASYIFSLTPICTNQMQGKPATAYWNATVITLVNNRTDILIQFFTYLDTPSTHITISGSTDGTTQDKVVYGNKNPYPGNNILLFFFAGAPTQVTVTIKNKTGDTLGSNSGNSGNGVSVNLGKPLPNEFTIVLD